MLFNRAYEFRKKKEFDKALVIYESIIQEDDTDAESHWCCALCRHGIEYVEDTILHEWLPTCHRIGFDSILMDVDYLAAMEHSHGISRKLYQREANRISQIQKSLLFTVQNNNPYDIFLCCKETDLNQKRTVDSHLAYDLYQLFTEKGYNVFLARVSLVEAAGSEYEPLIFSALHSSRIMIVIGTRLEYLEETWVKDEWSRFLALMRQDDKKKLIPCYRDISPHDMPDPLCSLQSFDMSSLTFVPQLLRKVKQILTPEHVQSSTTNPVSDLRYHSPIIMGFLDLELKKVESARDVFWHVLMEHSTCAEAYLGMVLITKGTEHQKYCEKFCQYATEHMSCLERDIFTPDMQKQILFAYLEMNLPERVSEALDCLDEVLVNKLYCEALTKYPAKDLLEPFLRHGCDPNQDIVTQTDNEHNKTPILTYLIQKGVTLEVLGVAIECGADPNAIRILTKPNHQEQYYSVLSDCIRVSANLQTIKLLLSSGADAGFINREYNDDGSCTERSLLHEAVLQNRIEVAKVLLDYGADPNHMRLHRIGGNDSFYSPLYDCVQQHQDPDMAALLLEYGADVELGGMIYNLDGSYEEKSPLNEAVLRDHFGMVELLLESHANPDYRRLVRKNGSEAYYVPLSDCILRTRSVNMMKQLLISGAAVNISRIVDNQPYTLLGDSIRCKKGIHFSHILLEHGADPSATEDICNASGTIRSRKNMLMLAALDAPSYEMIKLLHKNGASLDTYVWINGPHVPFYKYPLHKGCELSPEIFSALIEIGWFGPTVIDHLFLRYKYHLWR